MTLTTNEPPVHTPISKPRDGDKMHELHQPWLQWFNKIKPMWNRLRNQSVYSYLAPLTGFTFPATDNIGVLILEPAGTIATGTINFPPSAQDQDTFIVSSTQIVTAVTWTAAATVKNAPAGLAVGSPVGWVLVTGKGWYRTL